MMVLDQEGFLLYVDEIPWEVQRGAIMMNQRTGDQVEIVFIDRDENVIGFLPMEDE